MRAWLQGRVASVALRVILGALTVFALGLGFRAFMFKSAPPGLDPSSGQTPQQAATEPATVVPNDRMAGGGAGRFLLTKQNAPSPFRFAETARDAGIDFVHFSGMTDDKHYPTQNGSGVAMFDYDQDGRLDLYFATATLLPLGTARTGSNRLYKNLGGNRFEDVTTDSGLGFAGFCHGIVVGDLDNDGDQDVFLCNYGPNVLYLNQGDGTFLDISKPAGIDRQGWSSGGAFFDADNDGDLDLYVANYGEWVYPQDDVYCGDRGKGVRIYCAPRTIRTVKHVLYRNNGDLTFTDVTDAAGLGRSDGHGFGVVATDLNGDGRIDLFVANDMDPNFVYFNKGDGTFDDATETSGAALDAKGAALSGMGADAEDVDGDGLPEILVTNFANETNTLYQNLGKGRFLDISPYFGFASDTFPWVGWGTALADFDNDGWPDNFVTNGQVDNNRHLLGQNIPFEQPALLFQNKRGKRFHLATRDAGPYFASAHVGRGAAFGDLDDDGDIDIVVNQMDARPALLRNDSRQSNHWIKLVLQGTRSNRDAVGARVEVVAGGRTIVRQRKGGCSMLSSHDPRLLIGVGQAREITKLAVSWPSGAVSTLEQLEVDRTYQIIEPQGQRSNPPDQAVGGEVLNHASDQS